MDQEIKHQLEEIHALAKDNHQMLRAMRRHQVVSAWVKGVFWIVALVLPLFFYQQFIAPLISGGQSSAEIQKLINSYQAGQ